MHYLGVVVIVAVLALAGPYSLAADAAVVVGRDSGESPEATSGSATSDTQNPVARAMVGAYYFDGWAGQRKGAGDAEWTKNAPTHLTERLATEFAAREPVWGWRDDSVEIMERQIDLAADAGIRFFAFCWYWYPTDQAIRESPLNTPVPLFLRARNRKRMQFCLLVANHAPFVPNDAEAWKKTADLWVPYLADPQALKIDGKPAVIIYDAAQGPPDGFAYLQEAARKAGLPGVAVVGCGTRGTQEMGYGYRTVYNIVPGYASGAEEHHFSEIVAANVRVWKGTPVQPYIPVVIAGWDKRPWEGPKGLDQKLGWYFPDRSPDKVASFLRDAIHWMDAHPTETTAERLVLIYAWNELGEGGYLVPTRGDPEGVYLKAIRSVVWPTDTSAPEGARPEGGAQSGARATPGK